MSFADELRKAPEEKKKREELERQRRIEERKNDFNKLIQLTYTYIKEQCKRAALSESTTYNCEFKYKINDIIKSGGEEWWNRTRSRIEHKLNPKSDIITICFTEEDADTFSSSLESKLKGDGLTVNITKKELQNYKMDFVFVKRSDGERMANGILNMLFNTDFDEDEGEYKERKVKDGVRYSINISVSW